MNKGNKKVNDRELKLIFVLGGMVLFFLIYQFGYQNAQKANDELKSRVEEVRGEVKVMQTMQQNEETYKAYTESMTQEMEEIMDVIPSEIRSEDKIMFARSLENNYGLHITGVGIQEDEMVYEMNADGNNPTDDGKLLYRTVVNLDCESDYAQLKNCLRGLKSGNFKLSVDTASFSANEDTGKLTGTMTVNMYYLYGSDKPYEPLSIDGVSLGTSNIFGTGTGTVAPATPSDTGAAADTTDTTDTTPENTNP
ncbi:hypothetical protein ACTQ1U_01985 [Thermoguttaceae bacterium LCP21S3_D4]|nr:hypothetical protein [Lachnospiraceae bacterium]